MRSALVVLGAALCAAPLFAADGSVTIVDDVVIGEPPTSLTPVDAQFLVRLDDAGVFPVTVGWTTQDLAGMATSPADYVGASGTLTFNSNVTQAIKVRIQYDQIWEGAETFFLTLSTNDVKIGDGVAHGVITDQGSSRARCDLDGDGRSDLLIRTRLAHLRPPEPTMHNNRHDPYTLRGTVVRTVDAAQSVPASAWETPNSDHWEAVAGHDFDGMGPGCDVLWKWVCTDGGHQHHGRFAMTGAGEEPAIRPPADSEMLPDSALPAEWQSMGDWTVVGSGKLNSDTRADVLWWNPASAKLRVWASTGQGFARETDDLTVTAPNAEPIGALDIDADGDADILWRNNDTGALSYWLMQNGDRVGDGALTPNALADPCWQLVATGDFNGDGHDDLHWQNQNSQRSVVWFMDKWQRKGGTYLSPDHFGVTNEDLRCPAECLRDCSEVENRWYVEGPR